MPTATAVNVPPRLLGLRQTCDSMNIKWHWKHKESSLEELIKRKAAPVSGLQAMGEAVDKVMTDVVEEVVTAAEPEREKREIPQDVLDALDYCNGYHRGNTKCIRAYIDEIR